MTKMATTLPLITVGSEDTILLSLAAATSLYLLGQKWLGLSNNEKSRLQELHSVPQQTLHQAGTSFESLTPSRNICDAIGASVVSSAIFLPLSRRRFISIALLCGHYLD
jgi:hypothetical protein